MFEKQQRENVRAYRNQPAMACTWHMLYSGHVPDEHVTSALWPKEKEIHLNLAKGTRIIYQSGLCIQWGSNVEDIL